MARIGTPVDTAPRRGVASSVERSSPWHNDRSQSPQIRNRTTSVSPLLGESSTSQRTYNPALIFALTYCVGYPVVIQTKNGESFMGILHTAGLLHGESHFVLRKAKKMRTGGELQEVDDGDESIERLVIPSEECLQILAKDLPRSQEPPPPRRPISSPLMILPTDVEHGSIRIGEFDETAFLGDKNKERFGAGLYGRVLQPWVPEGENASGAFGEFDESKHEVGCWDQFEENEKRFGLKTDFNMDLYTTPLRVNESKYSVAEADELARLIRNSSTSNLHLQDERGQLAYDDSGLNDEMLYSSVLPDSCSSTKGGGRISKREELLQTPPRTPPASSTPKTRFRTGRQQPLIFAHPVRPIIINNNRTNTQDTKREQNRFIKDVLNAVSSPNGSPSRNSPLVGDQDSIQRVNLHPGMDLRSTPKRTFLGNFDRTKRTGLNVNTQIDREALVSAFKEFSKDMESKLSKRVMNAHKSPSGEASKPIVEPTTSTLAPEGDRVDEPILPNPPPHEETPPDGVLQMGLPKLNVQRPEGEEEEDGMLSSDQPNSGRGLNPHATPFNPGQGLKTKFESTLLMMDDNLNGLVDRSPKESSSIVGSSNSPKADRAVTPEGAIGTSASIGGTSNGHDKDLPQQIQEINVPPVVLPPQARMRQPPPPPPPPPRLRTPPPPPPVAQVSEMIPMPSPPAIVVQPQPQGNYRGAMRATRQVPSPGPRRGPPPQAGMMPKEPSPHHSSMIMMPVSRPVHPQGGTPGQNPGAQQAGMTHGSGPMHVPMHIVHGGMGPPPPPYGYPPPDVNGQIPVVYQYPAPMAPGPPPNVSSNPQNVQQTMMYPAYYPHPAMAPYGMPYGPPMMPQGPMPGQYVPMAPAPMNQQRPATGGGGRSRRPSGGRRSNSFFGPGPRRP